MSWTHVDELERIEMPDGFVWRPIRRRFDIRAFGVNAYNALEAGSPIVESHTEAPARPRGDLLRPPRPRDLHDRRQRPRARRRGARLRPRPLSEARRRRGGRGHGRAGVRRQAGCGARGVGLGGDVRGGAGRESRGLGRGDPHPRGGARREPGASRAPLQPRLHGGARRPTCGCAAAPAAVQSRSSRNGPRSHGATPTSPRSAASPASPDAQPRTPGPAGRPAAAPPLRGRGTPAPDRLPAAPRAAPRRSS